LVTAAAPRPAKIAGAIRLILSKSTRRNVTGATIRGRGEVGRFRHVIKSQPTAALSHVETISLVQPGIDDGPGDRATADWLAAGGDGRLVLDPQSGVNKYGCAPRPDPQVSDFGSSTASVISTQAFAAADALRARLADEAPHASAAIYAREMDRVRRELKALNGIAETSGVEVVFAASGSDMHLLVRELVGGSPTAPLLCLGVEPEETGSGVPSALTGRHFSDRAPLGEEVEAGAPIGPGGGDYVAIRARRADGRLRDGHLIEAELDALCLHASKTGRRVLLTVADGSKTGLISPGLETVLALRRRFSQSLEVLIDACQFRLSAASLRAYLDHGFMVAVTGSKFLTGPVFSGALFVPPSAADRVRGRILRPALKPYSARADWPQDWLAGRTLNDAANFGLLLRWEAALAELRAFRALNKADIAAFVERFARAVQARLADDPLFEPLPVRAPDRSAIGAPAGWDATPTIFPFLLREHARPSASFLGLATTENLFRSLMIGGLDGEARARLGQPVHCGEREGAPISALRLCNSARLIVEGVASPEAVIARAIGALDEAARVTRRLTQAGRIYG
jgi:hypothetical protein